MKVVAVSQLRQSLIAIAVLMLFVSDSRAQLPSTRLSAVFPPGGQVGTTVDVTLTSGLELEEISKLLFNHPGIVATPKTQDVGGKPVAIARSVRWDSLESAIRGRLSSV